MTYRALRRKLWTSVVFGAALLIHMIAAALSGRILQPSALDHLAILGLALWVFVLSAGDDLHQYRLDELEAKVERLEEGTRIRGL